MIAPIGANMKPYKATKPSNFIAKAGKIPATVAMAPAIMVAQNRDDFGIMA